ncbi:MAG: uracil-DNA glycosylase, partial [Clostridia bacterium]|nr:uracil-DNA glycosylase [Clostridia bacterium]
MRRLQKDMTAFFQELSPGESRALVFGEGDMGAKTVLIGEAPGEQEALQGRPFVGRAGKNLDELLELAGLERQSLYITNTVKFRPTKVSAAGRLVNRPPT